MIHFVFIPILTFGLECLYLSKSDREKIDFAYSTIFCKIFNVKERLNIQLCQYYSGCLPPSFRIDLKTLNFANSLTRHKNISLPLQLFMLFGKGEHDNIFKKNSVILSDNHHVVKSKFSKLIEAALF